MASKLQELIDRLCPDGVEYRKLGEVYTRLRGTPITATKMKEIASEGGNIRIFAGGKTVIDAQETDIPNANIVRVPAVLVQSRGVIDFVYYDKPFTFKNEMWAYSSEDTVCVKFLFYILKNNTVHFREAASGMGALPQISLRVTEDFLIPVPPLEIQREIVQILDNFAELTAELTAELEKRKKQYEYYRRSLLGGVERGTLNVERWPTVKLGDVCEMCLGKMLDKAKNRGRPQKYLANINVRWGSFDLTDLKEMPFEDDEADRYGLKPGDIVMCEGGEPGRCAVWTGDLPEIRIQKALHRIRVNPLRLNCRYLYHWFCRANDSRLYEKLFTGSTIKHLPGVVLAEIKIPLPPLAEQKRIVDILDRFDRLCNDLTAGLPAEIAARKKQYEYYRDKLLSFKRKVFA